MMPEAAVAMLACARLGVTVFYTAPTAIRALMREGEEPVKRYDLSRLRLLGTVGEPINPEAWNWYHRVVGGGRCDIVDSWWQTETGAALIAPVPGVAEAKPVSATKPLPGVFLQLVDTEGRKLEGDLVLTRSWPGQMRKVYGEVESALAAHEKVAEAAVVGMPHDIKGQGIYAFVTLNADQQGDEALRDALCRWVRGEIGPIAMPDAIQFAPCLPKTRSGKIMRRVLRKIAEGQPDQIGKVSTLADPAVVEQLCEGMVGDR